MKKIGLGIILGLLFGLALPSHALPPGQKMEFTKSPMGKVVFDGTACHPKPFEQKKGAAKITLADHEAGNFCFSCHKEGGKAWPSKDNCNKCHVK